MSFIGVRIGGRSPREEQGVRWFLCQAGGVAPHLEGVRESEGLGMFSPDPGEVVQKPVKWPI